MVIRRLGLALAVIALLAIVMQVLSGTSATYGTLAAEEGRELSLPAQLYLATGIFWGRYGAYILILLAVAGALWALSGRRAGEAADSR